MHLSRNQLLDPAQHGFVPNRSTLTQLLVMTQQWSTYLNAKRPFHCIYFDQKAAFDRVDHQLLINKLDALGIHSKTCDWLRGFLHNRSFRVRVGDSFSPQTRVTSGIPQGGCASAILFAAFVTDLKDYLPPGVVCLQYADDIKIYLPIDDLDSHRLLQAAVTGVETWCKNNGMLLSTQKSLVLKYGKHELNYRIDGQLIPTAQHTRDLGLNISPDLNFHGHILSTSRSANQVVNTLFQCFITRNPEHYVRLYKAIVVPRLLYCSAVWRPHLTRDTNIILAVQSRFISRLARRCGGDRSALSGLLPEIDDMLDRADRSAVSALAKADLIDLFFTIRENSLRSGMTVAPFGTATTDAINNAFSWRIARGITNGDIPIQLISCHTTCIPPLY